MDEIVVSRYSLFPCSLFCFAISGNLGTLKACTLHTVTFGWFRYAASTSLYLNELITNLMNECIKYTYCFFKQNLEIILFLFLIYFYFNYYTLLILIAKVLSIICGNII